MTGAVMETFWVTFLAAIVGGLLSYALSKRLNRAFQPPPARDDAALEPYPHSTLIRAAAYLVLTAWAYIYVLFPVTIVWALVSRPRGVPVLMRLLFGVFVFVTTLYLVIALSLRCKQCSRRLLVQTITKPPYGEPTRNMGAWERVIVLIAFHDRFRCMYCGQAYAVRSPAVTGTD